MLKEIRTAEGERKVVLHPVLSWVLGIAAVIATTTIIGTARTLLDLETRVTVLETNHFSAVDAVRLQENQTAQILALAESFVTVREYASTIEDIRNELRIIRESVEGRRDD